MSDDKKRSTLPIEGRGQPRIQAQVPIRIAIPGSGETWRGMLDNLSWGGAQIRCDELHCEVGDMLDVELPYHHRESIRIESEALRVATDDDGRRTVVVRFASVSPEAETRLENVLQMLLAGSGGGRREHPRLVQRLDIYFDDPADVRATLEDISKGGLSVTVPYSFSPNQSVQLTVFGGSAIGELRLRARVVHQSEIGDDKMELYRIGLKFEHPTNEVHDLVHRLLEKLASRQAMAARQWDRK